MIGNRQDQHVRDELNHRIELLSMDQHCSDITVALYLLADGSSARVHSYSGLPEVHDRLGWLADAMRVLGGMHGVARTVSFPCGSWHDRAARLVFLEACKVDPSASLAIRPLTVQDTRKDQAVSVEPLGTGAYRITAVPTDPTAASRAPAIASGLAKLADVEIDRADDTITRFACGWPHDALVGALLPRAINMRATLREQEMATTKGILAAPSAQETPG